MFHFRTNRPIVFYINILLYYFSNNKHFAFDYLYFETLPLVYFNFESSYSQNTVEANCRHELEIFYQSRFRFTNKPSVPGVLLSQVITLCVSHHVTKHGDRTLPSKYVPSTELCLWVMGLGVVCCRGPEPVGSGRREEGIKSRLSYGEPGSRGGAQGGVSRVSLKNVLTARGHLHGRTLKETLCCCYQSMFVVISLLDVSERFSISDCIPCYSPYGVWTVSVVSEKIFFCHQYNAFLFVLVLGATYFQL